jgi:hypothetical protein
VEALLQIGKELGSLAARMDALEARKCRCGCGEDGGPDVLRMKNDYRFWVRFARLLLDLGVTELNCDGISSHHVGCCKLINKLLDAVKNGGNGNAEAMELVAGCFGVG